MNPKATKKPRQMRGGSGKRKVDSTIPDPSLGTSFENGTVVR
jgi:hypothetical protein